MVSGNKNLRCGRSRCAVSLLSCVMRTGMPRPDVVRSNPTIRHRSISALRAAQAHCRGRGDSDDTDATCARILPGQLACTSAPRAPPRCHRLSAAPMQKPPPFGRGFLA